MNSQTLSQDQTISRVGELAPANLIEWKTSNSGTQWEKFRDSGSLDSRVYFAASPFQRWRSMLTIVLALIAVAAVTALIGSLHHPSRIVTVLGEQRSLTLADGSVISLNASSDARVAFTAQARRVILARGEALLTVANEPERPFLVSTPEVTVQAIGTVFDVRASSGETAVTVLEGRVSILPPLLEETPGMKSPPPKSLFAGERALVTREGKVSIRRVAGAGA